MLSKIYCLKLTVRFMATLSLLYRINQKWTVFRYFFHKTQLSCQWGLMFLCFFYVLNACMAWLNRSCVIVLPNQFSIRCIVEVDFSITTFVAGDTRYNLNSILISEKKTFSTPEHCFMYLVIPGSVFSSDAINFDAIQHRFHTDWHHLKK